MSPPDVMPTVQERRLTFSPKNHDLDNNENFSPDGMWLCYDTRPAENDLAHCRTIEKVNVETGEEQVLYGPPVFFDGDRAAPGIGAASFLPQGQGVVFIHGPPVESLEERGPYAKNNRCGACVSSQGGGEVTWLDARVVCREGPIPRGAHRGGTHRHEPAALSARIGFTYDDFLLPEYDRTIGYMEPHPQAPPGATHYFAVILAPAPIGKARVGEIERAWGDAWIGVNATRRAFIGKVREPDGSYQQSLFVAEIPSSVDITTADSGDAHRFPAPPQGIRVRRITHSFADGVVRGTLDGQWIAYYGKDRSGQTQIFVVAADGAEDAAEEEKRPHPVTSFVAGVTPGLRWHPNGRVLFCVSEGAVAAVRVEAGRAVGEPWYLTERDGTVRSRLVVSPKGDCLAYNRRVPTYDENGKRFFDAEGKDPMQIFVLTIPEALR
jgi:hypothetical protein